MIKPDIYFFDLIAENPSFNFRFITFNSR